MIKKALIIFVIAVSGIVLYGQPVAKSLFLGGDVSMYFEKMTEDQNDQKGNATRIRLMPMVGFFVTDHVAIGLKAGITSNVEKVKSSFTEQKRSELSFNITPLMRYYLTSGAFGIFAEGSVNLGFGKTKEEDNDHSIDGKLSYFVIGISPGIYYYITPKIGLEFSAGTLGYQYQSETLDETEDFDGSKRKTSQFLFDVATTGFSLGATIMF